MIQIRAADKQDAATLALLHQQHFKRGWSEAEFLSFFARDGVIAYLLFDQDKAVGFTFCWAVAGECELLCLAIDESYRRQGLAVQLCEQAMQDSIAGAGVMHLEVAISNKAAQALYRKLGFEAMRRRKEYYHYPDGTCEDAITMRVEL